MPLQYKLVNSSTTKVTSSFGNDSFISSKSVLSAVHYSHSVFDKFIDFGVDVFAILGMRNLSAFIGEVFVKSVERESNGLLVSNPHQDGYPDLLLLDSQGITLWESLKNRRADKSPFSPFLNGGVEIKATVGSVPTASICRKKGLEKPGIGDQRISLLMGYDWKAHHRETNNLLGILWDFIDGVPRIVAVFYSSELTEEDWGKIVKPKEGGGRTTSVSIMSREGIRKMYDGTILVLDDPRYVSFLNRYNKGNKL